MTSNYASTPWLRPQRLPRVLAVVDDPRLRDALVRGLGRHQLEVVAITAESALHALEEHRAPDAGGVDVVLVDVPQGPDPRALNVLRQVGREGDGVPTLGLASPQDASTVGGGALLKPIDMAELASELTRRARREA